MNDCDACMGKGDNENCMCGGTGHATEAVRYLRERLIRAEKALAFYADPDTYIAIAFLSDPPCGAFLDDFSDVPDSDYDRPMPGKRARETLSFEQGGK